MGKKAITSGFVYIWFDKKNKRFYVGSHWGHQNDKYICSSRWMRNAHKRRPEDFKRRILETISTTRQDLYNKEYEWLSLIKDEELGKKYYNLKKDGHVGIEYTVEMRARISAKLKGRKQSPEEIAKRSESIRLVMNTPEKKLELSLQSKARWAKEGEHERMSAVMSEVWKNPEHRDNVIPKVKAALNTTETKKKVSEASLRNWADPEYRQLQIEKHSNLAPQRKRTNEENIENSIRQKEIWSRDGYKEKMINAHLNSEVATESSKRNIRKTHTPEAIAKAKETRRLKREADAEYRKNNPEAQSEYKRIMKERAVYGAMKRWHPEQFQGK